MNRVDLSAAVLSELWDTEEAVWTTAEVIENLQEAYDDFTTRTRCLWVRAAVSEVAAQALYALPTGFALLDRVERDYWKLHPTNGRLQMAGNGAFESGQGRPSTYMLDGDGTTNLRMIPIPSASSSNTLYIEYYARGAALSSDTVDIEIPERYGRYLVHFAKSRCLERDGDGQDLGLAQFWMERYEVGAALTQIRHERYYARRTRQLGGAPPRNRRAPIGSYPAWWPDNGR